MESELTKLLLLIAAQGAIGTAMVAGIRAQLNTVTPWQSWLIALFISIVTCASWELYLSTLGQATPWEALPIKVLVVTIISNGWWSFGKTATGNS